jgi:ribosomal protein S17E
MCSKKELNFKLTKLRNEINGYNTEIRFLEDILMSTYSPAENIVEELDRLKDNLYKLQGEYHDTFESVLNTNK